MSCDPYEVTWIEVAGVWVAVSQSVVGVFMCISVLLGVCACMSVCVWVLVVICVGGVRACMSVLVGFRG